jgi:hypothetical protein
MVVKNLIHHVSKLWLILYIPQWEHGSKIGMRQTSFEKEESWIGIERLEYYNWSDPVKKACQICLQIGSPGLGNRNVLISSMKELNNGYRIGFTNAKPNISEPRGRRVGRVKMEHCSGGPKMSRFCSGLCTWKTRLMSTCGDSTTTCHELHPQFGFQNS